MLLLRSRALSLSPDLVRDLSLLLSRELDLLRERERERERSRRRERERERERERDLYKNIVRHNSQWTFNWKPRDKLAPLRS